MKTNFQLIVFDLDGTLIDSRGDIVNSVNESLFYCGLTRLDPELISSYVGSGVISLIRSALGENYTDTLYRKALKRFRMHYAEHMLDQTKLYPGVIETLEKINGVKKCVLTNKPQHFSIAILKGLGIDHFFSQVIGGDSSYPKKPDPASVRYLIQYYQVLPPSTLMVGDSAMDIQTGKNAGIKTCASTFGFGAADTLRDADHCIHRFSELTLVL